MWLPVLRIHDLGVRHRDASHRDGHGMRASVARFQNRPIGLVVHGRPVMLVCRGPVMVLGMIVIGVRVDVQP